MTTPANRASSFESQVQVSQFGLKISHRLAACEIQGLRSDIEKSLLTSDRNSTTRIPTKKNIVSQLFFSSKYQTL